MYSAKCNHNAIFWNAGSSGPNNNSNNAGINDNDDDADANANADDDDDYNDNYINVAGIDNCCSCCAASYCIREAIKRNPQNGSLRLETVIKEEGKNKRKGNRKSFNDIWRGGGV